MRMLPTVTLAAALAPIDSDAVDVNSKGLFLEGGLRF